MHAADVVNACFELVGSLFTWRNALQVHRDREVRGVWGPIWIFFAVWGLWNLVYYPSLGQWWSFAGGLSLVLGNLAWVAGWLRAVRDKRKGQPDPADPGPDPDPPRFVCPECREPSWMNDYPHHLPSCSRRGEKYTGADSTVLSPEERRVLSGIRPAIFGAGDRPDVPAPSGRCWCGRYPLPSGHPSFVLDGVLHERASRPGGFCGPPAAHRARDREERARSIRTEIRDLELRLRRARDRLAFLRPDPGPEGP